MVVGRLISFWDDSQERYSMKSWVISTGSWMTWFVVFAIIGPLYCKLFIDPWWWCGVARVAYLSLQTSPKSCLLPVPKQLQPHMTTLWLGRSFAQQLKRIFPVTKVRSVLSNTTPDFANFLPSRLWKVKLWRRSGQIEPNTKSQV